MSTGPIATALLEDVRQEVRRHGIVVWLDRDAQYTDFIDALTSRDDLGFAVHGFRGSHLELMLALGEQTRGVSPPNLVLHLPGFNEDAVRATPLYELYAAGVRFRRSLDSLVSNAAGGLVPPEDIQAFVESGVPSVAAADAWLGDRLDADSGELVGLLRKMSSSAILDQLVDPKGPGPAVRRVAGKTFSQVDRAALLQHFTARTGLTEAWQDEWMRSFTVLEHADLAKILASWAMCVEYVDDLRRAPVEAQLQSIPSLPVPVVAECRALAEHLRTRHAAFYVQTADETEDALATEVREVVARDLGRVDTFRFEERAVLEAALDALHDEQFTTALEWARLRLKPDAFWAGRRHGGRSTWRLVEAAAELGCALQAAGNGLGKKVETLEEAVEAYTQRAAPADRAHRELEQRRTRLWSTQLPQYEQLKTRLDEMRQRWRDWADFWAKDFSRLCQAEGFVPLPGMQQRTLFDDVVLPATREPGTTAYFVVDALRYEMAVELAESMREAPGTAVQLRARLCELPSVTDVGMNVLAPVSENGRLQADIKGKSIKGFHTGVFRVSTIDTRGRAMQERVGGAACPWWQVEEVLARDVTSLKRGIAQASLVVVHSQGIDKSGESGFGLSAFADELRKLRSAWERLRDAGVKRFVITADHGFLLLDPSAPKQSHGRKIDPQRRHIFRPDGADRAGEVRVALSDLGYDGAEGHVVFPDSTAVFDRGNKKATFVHGGNSLQERVIPVLTVVHRAAKGSQAAKLGVIAEVGQPVAGMHRISCRVDQTSMFESMMQVELALRVPDDPDVRVEICDVSGALLKGGSIIANANRPFEVFFRLHGPRETRTRVAIHGVSGGTVEPTVLAQRFGVVAAALPAETEPEAEPSKPRLAFLDELPPGVREVFAHLAAHGSVTETEAAQMLGSARKARRFSLKFEEYAALATFDVRIDVVAGVKRYVREGGAP